MEPIFPLTVFRHCPRCGSTECEYPSIKVFTCRACGFRYYQNAAAATIAIIRDDENRVLFTRRDREPARGMLDLPGGFVDPLEAAETAVVREVLEETGLAVTRADFLASFPNRYDYLGVTYYTCDMVFECTVADLSPLAARDEIAEVVFRHPVEVDRNEIGLPSVRNVVKLLCEQRARP